MGQTDAPPPSFPACLHPTGGSLPHCPSGLPGVLDTRPICVLTQTRHSACWALGSGHWLQGGTLGLQAGGARGSLPALSVSRRGTGSSLYRPRPEMPLHQVGTLRLGPSSAESGRASPSEQLGSGLRALAQEPAEHMPRVAAPSFFNSSIPVKPEDFAQPHGKKHLSAGSFPMHLLAFWVSVHMATFPYLPSGQSTHTPRHEVSAASTPGRPPASGQKLPHNYEVL